MKDGVVTKMSSKNAPVTYLGKVYYEYVHTYYVVVYLLQDRRCVVLRELKHVLEGIRRVRLYT